MSVLNNKTIDVLANPDSLFLIWHSNIPVEQISAFLNQQAETTEAADEAIKQFLITYPNVQYK